MKHFHDEIRIEAAVEHVWVSFMDSAHRDAWMPQRGAEETSGPLDQVGARYSQTMRVMGVEMHWTNEVVEVEPMHLIHVHSDYLPTDSYYRFERDGAATRLVIDCDVELPGELSGFLADLMRTGWMEHHVRRMCLGEPHTWHWPE